MCDSPGMSILIFLEKKQTIKMSAAVVISTLRASSLIWMQKSISPLVILTFVMLNKFRCHSHF